MIPDELTYFEDLKKEVVAAFRKSHPHCSMNMGEWKGQEIVDFQEELMSKVHGRLSEKWFYTHIKSPSSKLPRIDMLNMLSEYAGFKNWNDFVGTKHPPLPETKINIESPEVKTEIKTPAEKPKRSFRLSSYIIPSVAIIFLSALVILVLSSKTHAYKCCFVDLDGSTPVKSAVRITVLREGESPVYAQTEAGGCLELNEQKSKIKFVIATPYFRPDTFIRMLNNEVTEEKIQLKTDDYALMIHYFSNSNIKDWKNRRSQLNAMISENAKIFQVYSNNSGMELFNKKEFIDKLTMPLKSLRNIEITGVEYEGNLIKELRFTQAESK
jgi:hypothetical protein